MNAFDRRESEQYRANIDRHGDGAAAYIRDAVAAYCGK